MTPAQIALREFTLILADTLTLFGYCVIVVKVGFGKESQFCSDDEEEVSAFLPKNVLIPEQQCYLTLSFTNPTQREANITVSGLNFPLLIASCEKLWRVTEYLKMGNPPQLHKNKTN